VPGKTCHGRCGLERDGRGNPSCQDAPVNVPRDVGKLESGHAADALWQPRLYRQPGFVNKYGFQLGPSGVSVCKVCMCASSHRSGSARTVAVGLIKDFSGGVIITYCGDLRQSAAANALQKLFKPARPPGSASATDNIAPGDPLGSPLQFRRVRRIAEVPGKTGLHRRCTTGKNHSTDRLYNVNLGGIPAGASRVPSALAKGAMNWPKAQLGLCQGGPCPKPAQRLQGRIRLLFANRSSRGWAICAAEITLPALG